MSTLLVEHLMIVTHLWLRYDHATKPVYAVISTTTPNTIRYQANGTKVWEATYLINQRTQIKAEMKAAIKPTTIAQPKCIVYAPLV